MYGEYKVNSEQKMVAEENRVLADRCEKLMEINKELNVRLHHLEISKKVRVRSKGVEKVPANCQI